MESPQSPTGRTAFLFELDGTLVDSVYQHVLAWREATDKAGMELSVRRIHRRIGMSGGLVARDRARGGRRAGGGAPAAARRGGRPRPRLTAHRFRVGKRFDIPGRKRPEIDRSPPIRAIIA